MGAEVIFHVDMDAFYASVEQLDNPQLRGKPVIVGGRVSERGVVAACSYEARAFGVHSAMPMFQAIRLCPQGIITAGRMRRYEEVSRAVMEHLEKFAPQIQQISIDEAFLFMSGTSMIYGTPLEAGRLLKNQIQEILGLTISVGIGPSKFIAKMASGCRKPDGLHMVDHGKEQEFIDTLPIEKLWGLGKKTCEKLRSHGLAAPSQIRELPQKILINAYGESLGLYIYKAVRGIDPGILVQQGSSKSISNEQTFTSDSTDRTVLSEYLLELSHQVMFRSMEEGYAGYTAFVKFKLSSFQSFTCQVTLKQPVRHAEELYAHAQELLFRRWDGSTPIRLVGVGISSLVPADESFQGSLFDDLDQDLKKRAVEQAVFQLRQKGKSLRKASDLLKGFEKK